MKFQPVEREAGDIVLGMIREMEVLALLYAAVETGIFEIIRDGDLNVGETAGRKGWDAGALETLLNALTAANFIKRRQGKYELCGISGSLLENRFLLNNVKLAKVYTAMFHYPERVRGEYMHTLSPADLKVITSLGRYSASALAEYLVDEIPALKNEPLSLLDIGCGQGYHLMSLAQLNPAMRCAGIDAEEEVLRIAENNVKKNNLEKVTFRKGDMRRVEFGNGLDIITFFTSLRGMSGGEITAVIKKAYGSLKKEGYLIIHDFFLKNGRKEPFENVLFDMKLALSSREGKLLQLSEYEELKEIGFDEFRVIPVDRGHIPVKDSAFFIYRK